MCSKPVPSLKLLCACFALGLSAVTQGASDQGSPAFKAYEKKVMSIIGAVWNREVERNADLLAVGTIRLTFRITPEGRVENLKILSNTSNRALVDVSINAVRRAKLPPVPKGVLKEQGHNWVEVDIAFTIHL